MKASPATDAGGGATKPQAPHSAPRPLRRTDKNGKALLPAEIKKQSCFLHVFGVCPKSAGDCDRTHRDKGSLTAAEKPDYEAWAKVKRAREVQRSVQQEGAFGGTAKVSVVDKRNRLSVDAGSL